MSAKSKIAWTDASWNPVVGCTAVSPGCANCYAAKFASGRLAHLPAYKGLAKDGKWTGEVHCLPHVLPQPLHSRDPRMIFVCSMSDLFHEDVPLAFLSDVFQVMHQCPEHRFQLLTKRPERAAALKVQWWSRNIWLGTSCENQKWADERIPHLLRCPAAVRFVSYEPALGAVNVERALRAIACEACVMKKSPDPECWCKERISWLIIAGETGPRARRMSSQWALSAIEQCRAACVPVFLKQVGSVLAKEWGLKDKKGGDPEEWPAEFRVREWAAAGAEP